MSQPVYERTKKKTNTLKGIKHQKSIVTAKEQEVARTLELKKKKLERLLVDPLIPTIDDFQKKVLSNYLKVTHYLDNEIISHKAVEEKVEVKQKKVQEKTHSDDEESLKNILKELEKEKMPYNPIFFANNEELKFRAKNPRKKNNKYKHISLQNLDYRLNTDSNHDYISTEANKTPNSNKNEEKEQSTQCLII
jgi:hypothetical protein